MESHECGLVLDHFDLAGYHDLVKTVRALERGVVVTSSDEGVSLTATDRSKTSVSLVIRDSQRPRHRLVLHVVAMSRDELTDRGRTGQAVDDRLVARPLPGAWLRWPKWELFNCHILNPRVQTDS